MRADSLGFARRPRVGELLAEVVNLPAKVRRRRRRLRTLALGLAEPVKQRRLLGAELLEPHHLRGEVFPSPVRVHRAPLVDDFVLQTDDALDLGAHEPETPDRALLLELAHLVRIHGFAAHLRGAREFLDRDVEFRHVRGGFGYLGPRPDVVQVRVEGLVVPRAPGALPGARDLLDGLLNEPPGRVRGVSKPAPGEGVELPSQRVHVSLHSGHGRLGHLLAPRLGLLELRKLILPALELGDELGLERHAEGDVQRRLRFRVDVLRLRVDRVHLEGALKPRSHLLVGVFVVLGVVVAAPTRRSGPGLALRLRSRGAGRSGDPVERLLIVRLLRDDVVDEHRAAVGGDGAHRSAPGVHAALNAASVPARARGRRELVERQVHRGRDRGAEGGAPRERKARGDERPADGPGGQLGGDRPAGDARRGEFRRRERRAHTPRQHRPRVEPVPEPEGAAGSVRRVVDEQVGVHDALPEDEIVRRDDAERGCNRRRARREETGAECGSRGSHRVRRESHGNHREDSRQHRDVSLGDGGRGRAAEHGRGGGTGHRVQSRERSRRGNRSLERGRQVRRRVETRRHGEGGERRRHGEPRRALPGAILRRSKRPPRPRRVHRGAHGVIRRGVENRPGEDDPNPHEARGDVERRGDGGSRGGHLSRRDGRRLARRGRYRDRYIDAAEQRVFRGEERRHDDKRAAAPN